MTEVGTSFGVVKNGLVLSVLSSSSKKKRNRKRGPCRGTQSSHTRTCVTTRAALQKVFVLGSVVGTREQTRLDAARCSRIGSAYR